MIELPHSQALQFEPLVSLSAGRVIGFALRPGAPGKEALREACRTAARWPDGFTLAAALPLAQWRDPNTGLHVISALGKSGLPPARLELAIPEMVPPRDLDITRHLVDELRRFGVRIALCGCGVDAIMPPFEIDKIELGAALVRGVGRAVQSERAVKALLALAAEHGVIAAAAGIDTGAQFDALRRMNCAEGRGALFGPAVADREIPALLRIPGLADPLNEAIA